MRIDFTPETARAVIEITSHPKWAVFRTMYNLRRERIRDSLETSNDADLIRQSQGRADEIRKLLTLREQAEAYLQNIKQTREDSL